MGIGEALAEAFAEAGAHLVLAARNEGRLGEVANRVGRHGGKVLAVAADVTREDDVQKLLTVGTHLTGRVDVLINNAGVGMNGAVADLDIDALRQCLELNVVAPVRLIQAFLPVMAAAGGGSIVQVSSVLGKVSVPYTAGYNASKYALNAISDALRLEAAAKGITVISVYPGSTESNFRANSLGAPGAPKVRLYRMTSDTVARRVVTAVKRGERDVFVTRKDALLCWAATRFPRLADRILRTAYRSK
ncbi:MAG: short chain dehydrogenase/reductase family oxidoreductase [Symbiobacteriaceae bacterium]|jgi:short-subunit dehydrogenase|nr:short chain dehydrogenase/reductase family oxidoreductase [Symbiobacteriaceae bacterium]